MCRSALRSPIASWRGSYRYCRERVGLPLPGCCTFTQWLEPPGALFRQPGIRSTPRQLKKEWGSRRCILWTRRPSTFALSDLCRRLPMRHSDSLSRLPSHPWGRPRMPCDDARRTRALDEDGDPTREAVSWVRDPNTRAAASSRFRNFGLGNQLASPESGNHRRAIRRRRQDHADRVPPDRGAELSADEAV